MVLVKVMLENKNKENIEIKFTMNLHAYPRYQKCIVLVLWEAQLSTNKSYTNIILEILRSWSIIQVIQWPSSELEHITFVTRAVRVIDLITNLDMASFQTHAGWYAPNVHDSRQSLQNQNLVWMIQIFSSLFCI